MIRMALDPAPHVVVAGDQQMIRDSAKMGADLLSALRGHDHVALDCTSIGEVDLSFIQLIFSARRSADAAGRQFSLSAPPAGVLLEVLRRGGFIQPGVVEPATDPALWRHAPCPA